MRSRFLSIKKSTWLISSLIINLSLLVIFSVIEFLVFKNYNAWFFIFCINIGCHLALKGFLFKFDSSCYFGLILLFLGIFYFYCDILKLLYFYPVFIVLSFGISSFFTYFFFKQPYHLILSLSLIFVMIGLLLLLIKLISIWIFLAFCGACVLLLVLGFIFLK